MKFFKRMFGTKRAGAILVALAACLLMMSFAGGALGAGPELYDFDKHDRYACVRVTTVALMSKDGKTVLNSTGNLAPWVVGLWPNIVYKNTNSLVDGIIDINNQGSVKYLWVDSESEGLIYTRPVAIPESFSMIKRWASNDTVSWDPYRDGDEISFHGPEAEGIFSDGLKFEFKMNSRVPGMSGTFPHVRSTKEQLKCAPYVELITDGDNRATGFKVRFVDASNPDITLKKSAANDVWRVDEYEIAYVGEDERYEYKFPQEAIRDLDDIHFFQLRFKYESGINPNNDDLHVFHEWNYYVNLIGEEKQMTLEHISDEEKKEAENKTIAELDVTVKPDAKITTKPSKDVLNTYSEFGKRATGAVSFKAEAPAGEAVVVPYKPTFPIGAESLGGETLPPVTGPEDVKELYGVYKVFDDKSKIDILEEYGDDLFDISPEGNIVLMAAPVIINEAAPAGDSKVKRVGDKYGVRLSDDKARLYIYDGKSDEEAVDPFISMLKDDETPPGGGGCDAGFAFFGVLVLAGVCLFRRHGR